MPYESFYWDQIKARVNRLNAGFSEPKELSFLRLVTFLVTGLDPDEADEYITEGGDDLGSDSVYFDINDEESRLKLYIIQTKYNAIKCEQGVFNINVEEKVINKFKNIFDLFASRDNIEGINDELKEKKREYDQYLEDGLILDEIFFISANLGIGPAANVVPIIDRWLSENPYRDKIKYIHFGLEQIFKKIQELDTPRVSDAVQLDGSYFEYSTPDVKGLIGTISGNELVRLYDKFQDKLFEKNIRYYLGENFINKKIIKGASDSLTRDKFWFLNNGITIVCDQYTINGLHSENIKVNLDNFQIVNGTQTTRCISTACKNIGNADKIKALVKILKADQNLSDAITESTNSQNPVNKRDLRSNDDIQKLLETSLLSRGYFYRRKRNHYSDRPKDKIIDNLLFSQIYYSYSLGKPHEARNQRAKLFGDDDVYSKIFTSSLKPEEVIFLHELYKQITALMRTLKTELSGQFSKGMISRSKFFILHASKTWFKKLSKELYEQSIITETNKELVSKMIKIICDSAKLLMKEEELNDVKVFQNKKLVEVIKSKIDA